MWNLNFVTVLLLFGCFKSYCDSYRILGIVGWPSFSHQRAFKNLWRELALKGHNVTVITTNPSEGQLLASLTEISIGEGYAFLEETYDWSRYMANGHNSINFAQTMLDIRTVLAEFYIKLPQIQALINDKNQKFDVVLVEALFPYFLIFGKIFNAPTISISSFDPTASMHDLMGNPWNPIIYPSVLFPFAKPFNFFQRVVAVLVTNILKFQVANVGPANEMLGRNFPNNTESLEQIINKISFHFTAVNPLLLTPRPYSSKYVVIGGNTKMEEVEPLSTEVREFLNLAEEGFIYLSLGSNVKAQFLGTDFLQSISDVLEQIPYKVLWKSMDTQLNIPSNVKIVKWVPQRYVLTHPNIKLFITQGGIQSIEEAVLSKVPMVGVPIFGDQESNVNELSRHGIIKKVGYKEHNFKKNLKAGILEVCNEQEYKKNIIHFNELSQDQLISGTEKAIWYIEYTVRHKGNVAHLENKHAKNIPWYQYFMLDVLLFLVALVVIVVLSMYGLTKLFIKLVHKIISKHTKVE